MDKDVLFSSEDCEKDVFYFNRYTEIPGLKSGDECESITPCEPRVIFLLVCEEENYQGIKRAGDIPIKRSKSQNGI